MSHSVESITPLGNAAMTRLNSKWTLLVVASCVEGFLIARFSTHETSQGYSEALPLAITTSSVSKPDQVVAKQKQPARLESQTPVHEPSETTPLVNQNIADQITGLKIQESKVYVAVFESDQGFPHVLDSAQTTILQAVDTQLELELPFFCW